MSIFTKLPYRKKYYLTHPFQLLKHFFQDIECAYQKASRGYCYRDIWSIDDWFLTLFPSMLKDFKKDLHSYPAELTETEWNNIIDQIIKCFSNANADTTDFINKYQKDYYKLILNKKIEFIKMEDSKFYTMKTTQSSEKEKELINNYFLEEDKKQDYMQNNLEQGFELLKKYFYDLWD